MQAYLRKTVEDGAIDDKKVEQLPFQGFRRAKKQTNKEHQSFCTCK